MAKQLRAGKADPLGGGGDQFEYTEPDQEEKFLSDVLRDYNYWNKQEGKTAKAYAAAYRTLLNEFTAEENKE